MRAISRAPHPSSISRAQKKPVGCDNAFTSIASAQLATFSGRCVV
jgi:hypothetical protein